MFENYIHRALAYMIISRAGKKWEVLGLRLPLFFIQQFSIAVCRHLKACEPVLFLGSQGV